MIAALSFLTLLTSLAAPLPELSLRSELVRSAEPLTTERLWELAPDEPNPHRRRFWLDHSVDLVGLTADASGDVFRVKAPGLEAASILYLRSPQGPWFRSIEEFPCKTKDNGVFSTLEGAQFAAEREFQNWEKNLDSAKPSLSVALANISAPDAEMALRLARKAFRKWEVKTKQQLKPNFSRVRLAEWGRYKKEAAHRCLGKGQDKLWSWEDTMEAPSLLPREGALEARAPARRWDGAYTARVAVTIGDRKLIGHFLLDAAASHSLVSPSWLERQGAPARTWTDPLSELEEVHWSRRSWIVKSIFPNAIEVSGLKVPLEKLFLLEAQKYEPPRNISACCDGVLGLDALKLFAVEFDPARPAHVSFHKREGFRYASDAEWFEVSVDDQRADISSQCFTITKSKKPLVLNWDLTLGAKPLPRRSHRISELQCGGVLMAKDIPEGDWLQGIGFLGSEAFALDLGHGRIWVKSKRVERRPWGLKARAVEFEFELGAGEERLLKVSRISSTGPTEEVYQAGLRPGMRVTSLGGIPADELDQWEVEQLTSGAFEDKVPLVWSIGESEKSASLHF